MGCNCGKNKYPKKKSSRVPFVKKSNIINEGLTPDQRRSRMIKLENARRSKLQKQFNWEQQQHRNSGG